MLLNVVMRKLTWNYYLYLTQVQMNAIIFKDSFLIRILQAKEMGMQTPFKNYTSIFFTNMNMTQ